GGDELLDEIVVVLPAHAAVVPADIERISQALGIVGADVDQHRQRRGRIDTAAGGVERELADWDAHAAGALIAEAEDALAVGDDDHLGVVEQRVGEDLLQRALARQRQEQAARLAEQAAEGAATGANRRRVDDRQQFLEILRQQRVEQGLV